MTMDPTTESIAHFIGLFELKTEELRLRQDYLEFRLQQSTQEIAPLEPVGVRVEAPYQLRPYDPGLEQAPSASATATSFPSSPSADLMADQSQIPIPAPIFPKVQTEGGDRSSVSAGSFSMQPPGSLVSVTIQKITLIDDDLFLNGLGVDFVSPEALLTALEALVAQAEALAGFAMPGLPLDGHWMGFALDMLTAMDDADAPDGPAEVAIIRGDDAKGILVDGEAVSEVPGWTDLLPLYLRPEAPEEDQIARIPEDGAVTDGQTVQMTTGQPGAGQFDAVDGHDFGRDFEGHQPPDAPKTGHQIVAGANTAINEIALYSKWLDSAVYVVLGDVARVDAISQVNALIEHDTIDGVAQAQPSLVKNIAAISTGSSESQTTQAPAVGTPASSFIARIEADLIQVNWVKQFTFMTDFDRAEVVFSGGTMFLGLGENEALNSAVLNEFGHRFDLVSVAGDMVDATIVSQKNVLFDSDVVTTSDPALPASLVEPPPPSIPEHEAPLQIAELSPATPPMSVSEPPEPERVEVAPEPDTKIEAPALSLADNLLLNEVVIERTGTDAFADMKESFRKAAEELRDGAKTIAQDVMEDAMFAGKDALRVLQIDGDLARINLFEQTNIVGDADQIRLEMARLRDEMGAQAELIAGSNALINRVSVIEDGIDSTIMTAQNAYSDALIHQAGLFDADSVPTGVTMSNLTNDAVAAFIAQRADDMAKTTEHIVPTFGYEDVSNADVMQTALG